MSALPLKADVCGATSDVCYGPIADILTISRFVISPGTEAGDNRLTRACAHEGPRAYQCRRPSALTARANQPIERPNLGVSARA
jgi:hypothetical protein